MANRKTLTGKVAIENEMGKRELNGCVISEPMLDGSEIEIGRSCFCRIQGTGIYEICFLCRHAEGFRCHRTAGLFTLGTIPQWIYDNQ